MNTRLNSILTTLANQYAFHILHDAPSGEDRLAYLADGLANHGILVIIADIPDNNYNFLLRSWINDYRNLYTLIAQHLFPSFQGMNLGTADRMRPPIVVLQGGCGAIVQALAGYIVPYVNLRQQTGSASEAEIRGLMTYVLDDLDDELNRNTYNYLWRKCAQIIHHLMSLPIHQYALTSMKKPLFQQTHIQPQSLPKRRPLPMPPSTLPEAQATRRKRQEAHAKTQPMPIWFNVDDGDGKGQFLSIFEDDDL